MPNQFMKYLPGYYRTSQVMTNITNAEDTELQLFITNLTNTLNQFFVDLADTSLDRWEKELGIPVNSSKPDEYRRSVIKSKLRGQGTITVNLIKNVSESYSNGEVEVIEDNPNYSFTIKFVGTRGIPPNLDDLKSAIEEIKPAHLAVQYEFTYTTWGEVKNTTWGSIKTGTWKELKTRKVI
ncbi:YmfQ family protein [Caloranaerobacter sp. DY30410]|uniref:YmfQ family protein n=1 Tax=Caloranaerobacter sp. DY30410 TaxID=3238305 RepID=UPI003CFEBA58